MSIVAGPVDVSAARFAGLDVAPDLAVLIVSYQSSADLGLLLDSLRAEAIDRRIRVVVADNASTDGSVDIARAPGDIVVVETGGNLGYAGGLNAAMSHVGEAPAILVLNPDLVLEPGCIAALENPHACQRRRHRRTPHPRCRRRSLAVAATRARRHPRPGDALLGSRWLSRREWLSESMRSERAYAVARRIDWATGAAMLVDRAAWDAVGQWDERFFLYSEETDFFHRARRKGFDVWFEPAATVPASRGWLGFLRGARRPAPGRTKCGTSRSTALGRRGSIGSSSSCTRSCAAATRARRSRAVPPPSRTVVPPSGSPLRRSSSGCVPLGIGHHPRPQRVLRHSARPRSPRTARGIRCPRRDRCVQRLLGQHRRYRRALRRRDRDQPRRGIQGCGHERGER